MTTLLKPADINQVSLGVAERLLSAIDYSYLGYYQREILQFLLGHSKCLLLAARQTGKTELVSFLVALYVLFGHRCLIAMQTKTSGFDIFTVRINYFLDRLSLLFPNLLARDRKMTGTVDRRDYVVCANGGGFKIVSSDDAFKGSEGWSATLLVIDEAHFAKDSFFGKISPTQTLAEEGGYAKTIIMGVQGFKGSLIHTLLTDDRGFKAGYWDCYRVAESRPSYQTVIDAKQKELSEVDFAQFYELKLVASGIRYILPDIANHLEMTITRGRPVRYAGIDVGRSRDSTIVTVGEIFEDRAVRIFDHLELISLPFKEQAKRIVEFLRHHSVPEAYTMVELNSIGQAILEEMLAYSNYYAGMTITKQSKHFLVTSAQSLSRTGRLGIEDETCFRELEKLTYSINDKGEIVYEHSDYLSSLLMVLANLFYR